MALVLIPRTEDAVYVEVVSSPLDRVQKVPSSGAFLGYGLIRPFRRDEKNDFANTGGVELVKACVAQVLMTRGANPDNPDLQGELDWNPSFGSLVHLLRHKKNTLVRQELGRVWVQDALRRWEPRIVLKSVNVGEAVSRPNIMLLRIVYDVLSAPSAANQVLYSGVDQTLNLQAA